MLPEDKIETDAITDPKGVSDEDYNTLVESARAYGQLGGIQDERMLLEELRQILEKVLKNNPHYKKKKNTLDDLALLARILGPSDQITDDAHVKVTCVTRDAVGNVMKVPVKSDLPTPGSTVLAQPPNKPVRRRQRNMTAEALGLFVKPYELLERRNRTCHGSWAKLLKQLIKSLEVKSFPKTRAEALYTIQKLFLELIMFGKIVDNVHNIEFYDTIKIPNDCSEDVRGLIESLNPETRTGFDVILPHVCEVLSHCYQAIQCFLVLSEDKNSASARLMITDVSRTRFATQWQEILRSIETIGISHNDLEKLKCGNNPYTTAHTPLKEIDFSGEDALFHEMGETPFLSIAQVRDSTHKGKWSTMIDNILPDGTDEKALSFFLSVVGACIYEFRALGRLASDFYAGNASAYEAYLKQLTTNEADDVIPHSYEFTEIISVFGDKNAVKRVNGFVENFLSVFRNLQQKIQSDSILRYSFSRAVDRLTEVLETMRKNIDMGRQAE